jgi:hypothetical protein
MKAGANLHSEYIETCTLDPESEPPSLSLPRFQTFVMLCIVAAVPASFELLWKQIQNASPKFCLRQKLRTLISRLRGESCDEG